MSTRPLLTIGIPAVNEGKFLEKTLVSILNQTFRDFVVVICEDSSTDNTLEISNKFAAIDNRIYVRSSKRKLNFVENWTRSLEACETKYFAWIGAHDILHREYFEEAIGLLEADNAIKLVYPLSIEIDADGNKFGSMDSDIDTTGINYTDSILKIAENLNYCTAIHGVFETSSLKKMPVKRILGFDFLILFLIGLMGKIKSTKTVKFYRRTVRKENEKDRELRWLSSGMFEINKYHYHEVLVKNCIFYFFGYSKLSVLKKTYLVCKLFKIFKQKFGLSNIGLSKCFFNL